MVEDTNIQYFQELMAQNSSGYESEYQFFRKNYRAVAKSADNMVVNKLKASDIKEEIDSFDYDRNLTEEDVDKIIEHYQNLGIVPNRVEKEPYSGEDRYLFPDYHGKGSSTSWEDIMNRLESEMLWAEREYCWTESGADNNSSGFR